jgi:hypothetical protein
MKNIVYLDTEFTTSQNPDLLSLGLVSLRGNEHYVELDPGNPANASTFRRCSDFVREGNVLAQWGRVPGSTCTRQQMGHRTADWIRGEAHRYGAPVQVAFDHETDYRLFKKLIQDVGRWEEGVELLVEPLDVAGVNGRFDTMMISAEAIEVMSKRGLERHHALADAFALRAACYAYFTGRRPEL